MKNFGCIEHFLRSAAFALFALSTAAHAEDWTENANRVVIGGSLSHFGVAESSRADAAIFLAKAMAVAAVAAECGDVAHRDIKLYKTELKELAPFRYRGYARASLDFESCEESRGLGEAGKKKLESTELRKNIEVWHALVSGHSSSVRNLSKENASKISQFFALRKLICLNDGESLWTIELADELLGPPDRELQKSYQVRSPVIVRIYEGIEMRFDSETGALETLKGVNCYE